MDPQIKSVLTTIAGNLALGVAGAAATHGYIHSQDQVPVADAIVTAVGAVSAYLIGWWKKRQASPAGLVQSIGNSDPKKVAAAIDAAPPATKTTVVQAAVASNTIPTMQTPLK